MKRIRKIFEMIDKKIKVAGSKIDINLYKKILISTFVLGFIVHGFAYANEFFSHDSITYFNQLESELNIKNSSGRFMQFINIELRGSLTIIWVLGILSLFWISISSYLIVKTFNFKNKVSLYVVPALLVSNHAFVLLTATYAHEVDTYMLGLLFAVLPTFLFAKNEKISYFLSPICIMIMCAIYQAYLSVTIILFMWIILKRVLDNKSIISNIITGLKSLGIIASGLILYQIMVKIVNLILGSSANRVEIAYNFINVEIIENLKNTYTYFFKEFLNPITYNQEITTIVIVGVIIVSIVILISCLKKQKITIANIMLLMVLIAVSPLCASILYFLSAGKDMHYLMTTGFVFMYILTLIVLEYWDSKNIISLKNTVYILIIYIIFNQVIYANAIYLEKELIIKNTDMTMNRILYDIEKVEGYKIDETKVMFIGSVRQTDMDGKRTGLEFLKGTGISNSFSLYTYKNYRDYYNDIIGYPINIVNPDIYLQNSEILNEIKEMPSFPNEGYVKEIQDIIVVKIYGNYNFK